MRIPSLRLAAVALMSGISLGGCAYGYDPYGPYGGVSVGYGYGSGYPYGGYGYGYDPYYSYGSYGGYYGSPFGWYDNYYYPGTGIYVYDRYRTRHVWTDSQKRYWSDRRQHWQSTTKTTAAVTPRENWSGFTRNRAASTVTTRSTTRSNDDSSSQTSSRRHGWRTKDD
ncbi:MAG TPA: hypothetical protein VNB78_03445 [Sphingomicrobium sp.]|nr:hypothetical protein [Sphingomicrobium sp.]